MDLGQFISHIWPAIDVLSAINNCLATFDDNLKRLSKLVENNDADNFPTEITEKIKARIIIDNWNYLAQKGEMHILLSLSYPVANPGKPIVDAFIDTTRSLPPINSGIEVVKDHIEEDKLFEIAPMFAVIFGVPQ